MGKKLEANGLWESSRMILPEHKEQIRKYRVERNKKQRPTLDEQRIEELVRTISVSLFTEKAVKIRLYGDYEDREVIGRIDKIATDTKQLKIGFEDDSEWIRLEDVLEMDLEP